MAHLAIAGGNPVRNRPWPAWPMAGEEERVRLDEVLDNVHGADRLWGGLLPCPKATELEQKFSSYHGCQYGTAVSTGAAAIEIALLAAGLELGDEVLTTPLTWVATASCILRAGGVPVFVDVENQTYAIDPDLIEDAITPRTKAILPVHLAGYPAQIDRITAIAEKYDLIVVEDCAQAHGTLFKGKPVGSFGQVSCFSFQNSKLMASGEGGIILTNDKEVWRRSHSFKDCGRLRGNGGYVNSNLAYEQEGWGYGMNFRLSELQAAVLLAQLERMDVQKQVRMANACRLFDALEDIEGVTPLHIQEGQNIWRFIINYSADAFEGLPLEKFIAAVQTEGIPLQHFPLPPLPQEGLFRGYLRIRAGSPGLEVNPRDYSAVQMPVAGQAYRENIAYLQQNILLADAEDIDDIVKAIAKVQRFAKELL